MNQDIRLMLETEIPDFVIDVVTTGCDICAIGDDSYVIGDADLPDEEYEAAVPHLVHIDQTYDDRDPLLREIAAYLRSIGRYVDPGLNPQHWRTKASTSVRTKRE
ncbi:hypothetical protein ILFOPFJJ_06929 [Ensifer psoraleae]|nr:hypothetical protein [Sinorhizobium psoraleae]